MITLKISGKWLADFLQEGHVYDPICIYEGLPKDAVFRGVTIDPHDPQMMLMQFQAHGPSKVMEAMLMNANQAALAMAGKQSGRLDS